jgi:hypothetical protein
MTSQSGDEWIDAKIAECTAKEHAASRKLDKPVRAGLKVKRAELIEGRVYIDDLHYFEVSLQAWNLRINGWQVTKKWLVDRRGCTLSQDDTEQYHRLLLCVNELCKVLFASDMVRSIMEDMTK